MSQTEYMLCPTICLPDGVQTLDVLWINPKTCLLAETSTKGTKSLSHSLATSTTSLLNPTNDQSSSIEAARRNRRS